MGRGGAWRGWVLGHCYMLLVCAQKSLFLPGTWERLLFSWAAQTGVSRPKISPVREKPTSPVRETQRPLLGRKPSFGSKNPVKAGDKKSRETGSFRAKTPKTDLWHHGFGHLRHQPRSHSPETGFSKSGFPLFPGIFQGAKISNTKNSEKSV